MIQPAIIDQQTFEKSPDHAGDWIEVPNELRSSLRLIKVTDLHKTAHLDLVMDDDQGKAAAYFTHE